MKYNSTISKNKLLMHTKTKMNLKIIMLGKPDKKSVYYMIPYIFLGFPVGISGKKQTNKQKNLPASVGDVGFDLQFGVIPWWRKWQPIPVSLPGKFQGQRRLAGCSP